MNTLAQKTNSGTVQVQSDFEPEYGRTFGARAAEAIPSRIYPKTVDTYAESALSKLFLAMAVEENAITRTWIFNVSVEVKGAVQYMLRGDVKTAAWYARNACDQTRMIPECTGRREVVAACSDLLGRLTEAES